MILAPYEPVSIGLYSHLGSCLGPLGTDQSTAETVHPRIPEAKQPGCETCVLRFRRNLVSESGGMGESQDRILGWVGVAWDGVASF